MEDHLQCGDGYGGALQGDAEYHAEQKLFIREKSNLKDGVGAASHIQGMDQLGQGEHSEAHRTSRGISAQHVGEQGEGADEHALNDDSKHAAASKEAFCCRDWRMVHNIAFRWFQSQTDGGERIRDKIDKQELHREQRGSPSQQDRYKDRHDLSDVTGKEKMDGLFYVLENSPALLHRIDDGGEIIVH